MPTENEKNILFGIYCRALINFDQKIIYEAVMRSINKFNYPAKPSELIELCKEVTKEKKIDQERQKCTPQRTEEKPNIEVARFYVEQIKNELRKRKR